MAEQTKVLKVFVCEDEDGSHIVWPDYILKQNGIEESVVEAKFPDGKWHTISYFWPFLTKHDAQITALTSTVDGGTLRRAPEKFNAALIAVVVKEWTLDYPTTVEGYGLMPFSLGNTIANVLNVLCYSGGMGNPDFLLAKSSTPDG